MGTHPITISSCWRSNGAFLHGAGAASGIDVSTLYNIDQQVFLATSRSLAPPFSKKG